MAMNRVLQHSLAWTFLLLVACGPPDTTSTLVIGHGGWGANSDEPMNSRAAMMRALDLGIDGVELDIQLTSDSVLVAYHAQDLSELTECLGLLNAWTWSELKNCSVMSRTKVPHAIERVDSLLYALMRGRPDLDVTLDCKLFAAGDWWTYLRTYVRAITALNKIPLIQGHLNVECQVDDFLLLLQHEQPYIPIFRYATNMEEAIWRAVCSRFTGVVVSNDRVSGKQVRMAQELGLVVTIFGVGDRWGHYMALRKGPDRLQTDAPEHLR